MAFGKIKADAIIRDNSGSDEEITMATIAGLDSGKAPKASPTFTGTVTVPDVTATGDITLNAQQELRLADSDSSNYVALKAPATVGSNVTLTLPANDGDADQYLQTNGSGVLTWADVAGDFTYSAKTAYSTGMIFTGIPSTVTQMIFLFDEIYNSADRLRIQLGTSSAFTSSGYIGHTSYHGTSQSSFRLTNGINLYAAGHYHSGWIKLYRTATNGPTWYWAGSMTMSDGSNHYHQHNAGHVETGSSYALNRVILENMSGGGDSGHVTLGYK